MKKPVLFSIIGVVVILIIGIVLLTRSGDKAPGTTDNTQPDLPINTIPVEERPFITLTPDKTGHSLDIAVSGAPKAGSMEYEMIYSASGKQEGALGSIFLASEKQPIVKSILLGSRSAGGATTYHEGVTGGSLTLTYGETRLKESWNYLHFNPLDPTISSTDGKFSVTLTKTALKQDEVVVTMKNFGVSGQTGLPAEPAQIVVGPYGYFAQSAVKGAVQVSLKLPSTQQANPTIYEYTGTTWKKVTTKLAGDTVTATVTANAFVVMGE